MSNSYSHLKSDSANFNNMLKNFGVVTVMNAKVFNYTDLIAAFNDQTITDLTGKKADEILKTLKGMESSKLCDLKTLKVANVTLDGPSKTVTGGQYANPLIKFGKTATMEIQDALGNADAIEALGGGLVETFPGHATDGKVLHIGTDFASAKVILGDSFFIDQKTGQQVSVNIIFYQFLPDSLFNLTQDSEGDATVFDMNGSLLTTDILIGDDTNTTEGATTGQVHGVFYSIISPTNVSA